MSKKIKTENTLKKHARNDRTYSSEIILAIGHLTHAEQHIMELMYLCKNKDSNEFYSLIEYLNEVREMRVNLMNTLKHDVPNIDIIWCTFKHLIMTDIHLSEAFNKSQWEIFIEYKGKISGIIDKLFASEHINHDNIEECVRCEDDKSIMEDKK